MKKIKSIYKIINSVNIPNRCVRDIYDDSQRYMNGHAESNGILLERNIKRALVNHIRHKSNFNYHRDIKRLSYIDKNNRELNYRQYKNSILYKIGEEYPFLKEECYNQRMKLNMVNIINKEN